jgi:hypothetical protein
MKTVFSQIQSGALDQARGVASTSGIETTHASSV